MDGRRRPQRLLAFTVFLLLGMLAAAGRAYGDGPDFRLYLKPGYNFLSSTTADEAGRIVRYGSHDLLGEYRLNLKHELLPFLRYSAGGFVNDRRGFNNTNGVEASQSLLGSNVFGILSIGQQFFGVDLGYNRRSLTSDGSNVESQTVINESISLAGHWLPEGLPGIHLRYNRVAGYDMQRFFQDTQSDSLQVSAVYDTISQLDVRYLFGYQATSDNLTGTDSQSLTHSARASYRDSFFNKRLSVSADYSVVSREIRTQAGSADGKIYNREYVVEGLSLIERFPDDPMKDTLNVNPGLIDGNLTSSASINLGYDVSVGGDTDPRDLGGTFADATREVNTVYVWVDRRLPDSVAQHFTWSVYISDDNVNWTAVALAGPTIFDAIYDRFEISFESVKSRYVKVVTSPLASTATVDPQFRDINVTELQFFLVKLVSEMAPETTDTRSVANATIVAKLTKSGSLQADASFYLSLDHTGSRLPTYRVSEGLTFHHQLSKVMVLGRVGRDDSDEGKGHVGTLLWNASAAYRPLKTLRHSLAYNGNWRQKDTGTSMVNSVNIFNRGDLYDGISLLFSAGYSLTDTDLGQRQHSFLSRVGTSLTPHRTLTLTGTYAFNKNYTTAGEEEPTNRFSDSVNASLSFTPVPALMLSAQLSHRRTPDARLLASFSASLAPFPDGALRFSAIYTETIDPASDRLSRRAGSSVRWNIRPGLLLDSNFSYLGTEAATGWSRLYVFSTTFTASL